MRKDLEQEKEKEEEEEKQSLSAYSFTNNSPHIFFVYLSSHKSRTV